MTEPRPVQARLRAALWLLLCVAALGLSARVLSGQGLVADLFAMLPEQTDNALLKSALAEASTQGSAQIVLAVGAAESATLSRAERMLRERLARELPRLREVRLDPAAIEAALRFQQRHRQWLASPALQQSLAQTPVESSTRAALARLLQPLATEPLPWSEDPLGLVGDAWSRHWQQPGMQWSADGLRLQAEQITWAVLRYELQGPAFDLSGERVLGDAFERLALELQAMDGGIRLLYAGVPLHADAAAAQAAREMSTIGLGSLLAVLLLVALAYRSLRPLLLIALSLLLGCAIGLAATVLVFGEVHLLALVFGSSLVGVAEDYGIHYFAARQAQPQRSGWRVLAELRPSLWLALLTSALAYLALGALPFPGLRQMAVFSACGLAGAFITVLLLFPLLDAGAPRSTPLARRISASLQRWPALAPRAAGLLTALLCLVCAWPLSKARSSDDLRQLQGSPASLIDMQRELSGLLGLPSPAQFFIVEADSADAVLQQEQRLLERLRALRDGGRGLSWQALSDWLPPAQAQRRARALLQPREQDALRRAGELTGEPPLEPAHAAAPLTWSEFADSPLAQLMPQRLFGQRDGRWYSVVQLGGLLAPASLPELAAQARGLPGVHWVDRTADYTRLLREYRQRMSLMLGLGLLLVAAVLVWRYRARAWRALLPTVLAGMISLAALAALGQPIYLFNVLALLLLLGIGVDYGIFLLEQADGASWLAVALGAASTLLAFGLLALSATPALRAFGLTLLFGIAAVWLLSPLYRDPTHRSDTEHAHA